MTLRAFIEDILDRILNAIRALHIEITNTTLTGSIVSFISKYAGLPLKSHKIAVTATQSGSGTPSPDNVRTINGYSAINIGSDNKYAGFINYNQISPVKSAIDTKLGITAVQSTDGTVMLNGTAEGDCFFNCSDSISIPVGHKVFLCGCPAEGGYSTFYGKDGYTSGAYDVGEGAMLISKNVIMYQILAKRGVTFDNVVFKPQIFDLTVMFGATKADEIYNMEQQTEGSGVAYFRSLFPNDYYDYNAGTLTTVSAVNGSTNSFFTINLGGTYYGGEYDARTGVLTISRNVFKLVDNNQIALQSSSNNNNVWRILSITSNVKNNDKQLCNIATYNVNAWSSAQGGPNTFVIGDEGNLYLQLPKSVANTLSDFITFITNNDIYFYNEMATPITIQLPPCPIDTLEGVNNIWADTGDTTIVTIEPKIKGGN